MRKENRIIYLDLLRVILIFSMMLLHVAGAQWAEVDVDTSAWQTMNFYDGIMRFCVPVFVMLSGIFILDPSRQYTLKRLLKVNVLRIATAFFFWSFCYAVWGAVQAQEAFDMQLVGEIIRQTVEGHYHMWFLYMIAALYIIVPFLSKIAEDKKLTEYFMLLAFIFMFITSVLAKIPGIDETVIIVLGEAKCQFVLGYTGYFLAGHYFSTYEMSPGFKKTVYVLGAVSAAVTVLGTSYMSLRAGEAEQMLYNYMAPNICFTAVAVFFFFKDFVSKVHFSDASARVIVKLSELSFGMYLMHDFVNMKFAEMGITSLLFTPVLSIPVITLLVFLISFAVTWLMSKVAVLKKYVM